MLVDQGREAGHTVVSYWVSGSAQGIEGAFAVVGRPVEAPQAGSPDVAQLRAELEAQKLEDPEHAIGIGPRIRHDLSRLQRRLLTQQEAKEDERVTQGAGDDDAVQADTLISNQVLPGDATLDAEVSGVLARVDCAQRDDKAEAVSQSHVATAPELCYRAAAVGAHQDRVGCLKRFAPHVVLLNIAQAIMAQRRCVGGEQGSKVARLAWHEARCADCWRPLQRPSCGSRAVDGPGGGDAETLRHTRAALGRRRYRPARSDTRSGAGGSQLLAKSRWSTSSWRRHAQLARHLRIPR